jgi:hypothetical protein
MRRTCQRLVLSFWAFASLGAAGGQPVVAPSEPEVEIVASLYREFAWEAMIDEPLPTTKGLLSQSGASLSRFFTHRVVELLLNDRECSARTKEVCKLDFSPMWASQDPMASELRIYQAEVKGIVRVQFKHPATGEVTVLRYRVSDSSAGLRIEDIQYQTGPSLTQVLQVKQ